MDQAQLFNAASVDEHPSRYAVVIDFDALHSIRDETAGKQTRIARDTVALNPGHRYEQMGSYGRAVVATISGSELGALYERYGDKLFARNVRLFLGTRAGGVNAGIQDTLASDRERSNFWAYNNGITVVCDDFELASAEDVINLRNFSVVNGCQTTVSLYNSKAADKVQVLVRFIAAPEAMVDNIIFYTNSQTPIRGWELRSQDKTQKRLQKEMAEDPNPYYYALRRGEARTLTQEDRGRFTRNNSFQTVPQDVVAQYLASFRGLPYVAYKDKGKIFSQYYDSVFPRDISVEQVLLAWRAGDAADIAVKAALERALADGDELGLVILKRGARMFVVAVMSMLLQRRNGPNYVNALKREVVTSKATADRLATYAQVAVVLYQQATRRMVGDGGLPRLASILRTQDSYGTLSRLIQEEWQVRSIDKSWVNSLPQL